MSKDIEFIEGLSFKAPKDGAPDFIIARGSIKRQDMIDWLSNKEGEWINFDLKEAKGGKLYASVDNWKPDPNKQADNAGKAANLARGTTPIDAPSQPFPEDDIPF